jgi:hypothetical protein
MNTQKICISQFHAALEMLNQCIQQCPESLWDDESDKNRFWHLTYHALFYTHLYLHPSGEEFVAWEKHRENYNFMGTLPWPPHETVTVSEAYTKQELLEFYEVCWAAVNEMIKKIDLTSETSGFDWIPMGKLELQLYNLRHLQQHTGELMERLGTRAGIDIAWVGMKAD